MTKSERHGHDSKREPAKFAERYLLEVFVDHKAQQEGAPKNFFHHRNNDNEAKETKSYR